MAEFTTLIDGLSFTECPRWRDGRLYLSDFYTHRVLAVAMDGSVETIAEIPNQPSGLGFMPDGELLIVSMRDRKLLRRNADGTLVEHADLFALAPWHLNDMLVDGDGRAWVGNFGFDLMSGAPATTTVLIQVEADGTASCGRRRTRLSEWDGPHARRQHAHRGRVDDEPAQRLRRGRRQARRTPHVGVIR